MIRHASLVRRAGLGLITAFLALGLSACDKMAPQSLSDSRTEVTFSVLSTEKSKDLQKYWAPFFADMEKQTGLKVTPFYAPNYTSLIEAMRFNKVQVGWFSNVAGLEAVNRAQGEVFVKTSYPEGVEGYRSVIITKASSHLTAADILKCNKSLNFGMGDVKSTSGTQAPLYYFFLPAKKDPNSCFKAVKSGSHQANIEGVLAGVMDAATNNSTALWELKDTQPEKYAGLKIIWQSPILPSDTMIYRKDLDPATKEKIRSFFLSYGTQPGAEGDRQRAILRQMYFGTFSADDNNHFLPIRLMQASTDLMQAQQSGDPVKIKAAEEALKVVEADKAAYDAKRPVQAAPDPQ